MVVAWVVSVKLVWYRCSTGWRQCNLWCAKSGIAEYDNSAGHSGKVGFGGDGGGGGTGTKTGSTTIVDDAASAGNKEEVAKSETTIQLLIGLIAGSLYSTSSFTLHSSSKGKRKHIPCNASWAAY
ncbi:unnamed protein product [Ceratitis capitata]|uniref:(Mediterranean fruit fly) hypothetical protein n=1 Tax=Ceratitis capitata TaxID=7213 RepID=A0A811UD96_CERCA|nr:unnamed protein product [Ceratitis capitata]